MYCFALRPVLTSRRTDAATTGRTIEWGRACDSLTNPSVSITFPSRLHACVFPFELSARYWSLVIVPRMTDPKNPPLVPPNLLSRVARRLKVIGEPVRLELLNLLRVHEELSVQALVDASGQRQANVSKHLGVLMREGLVQRRKEGVKAFYSLADPSLPGICVLVTNQLKNETAPSS